MKEITLTLGQQELAQMQELIDAALKQHGIAIMPAASAMMGRISQAMSTAQAGDPPSGGKVAGGRA